MISIRLENAIINIVDAMLPHGHEKEFGFNNIGLLIGLDLREESFYEHDKCFKTVTTVPILFQRTYGTKVLINYKFNNGIKSTHDYFENELLFKRYADHESEWKNGISTFLGNHVYQVEKEHKRKYREIEIIHNNFSIFMKIQYVDIFKLEPIYSEKFNRNAIAYNTIIKRMIY